MNEAISPNHYQNHASGVEAIVVAELLGFNLGNAFKYLFRCGHKDLALQDLRKAQWYLQRHSDYSKVPSSWYQLVQWFFGKRKDLTENQELVCDNEDRYSGWMAGTMRAIFLGDIEFALDHIDTMIRVEEHHIYQMELSAWLNKLKVGHVADWRLLPEGTYESKSTKLWIKAPDAALTKSKFKWREGAFKQIFAE